MLTGGIGLVYWSTMHGLVELDVNIKLCFFAVYSIHLINAS